MANHPNRSRRRYRVHTLPGASDKENETHFVVVGPRVDEFDVAARMAELLEAALNAADRFAQPTT